MRTLAELDPREAAARLVAEQDDPTWLSAFAEELDRRLTGEQLGRVLSLWQLSRSDLGRLFGVSRQAATKWLSEGVPPDRVQELADVAAINDLLVRHLKRERVAAVVRRPAPSLSGLSLLDLVGQGRAAEALEATRAMFAFADLHR
jgi:hypothetical protein